MILVNYRHTRAAVIDQDQGDAGSAGQVQLAGADCPCRASCRSASPSLDSEDLRTVPPYWLSASVALSGVTFSTMFKPVVTEDYPRNPLPTAPRYHGRHQLNRHPDGMEKCVVCELCAWACPARSSININISDQSQRSGGCMAYFPKLTVGAVEID